MHELAQLVAAKDYSEIDLRIDRPRVSPDD